MTIKLRKMDAEDWFGFQGAENFEDGSEPLIDYVGNNKVVILDATGLNVGIGNSKWYRLECTKELGVIVVIAMTPSIDEEELIRLGFEDIM